MKSVIIDKANENKIESIYLRVIKENKRANRAYHREGFVVERENADIIEMVLMIKLYEYKKILS